MDVPEKWRTETDASAEKLVFSYDFYKKNIFDYLAIRVEQFDLTSLLRGEFVTPKESDLTANSWADVIQPPVTAEQVGLWIMRHKQREAAAQQGSIQGTGGKVVAEKEESDSSRQRRDVVTDATLLEDVPKDSQGSGLLFHVKTTIVQEGQDESSPPKVRGWSVKAVLQNGTITVGYITGMESHFLPDAGPIDQPWLDRVVSSLRLLPPAKPAETA